MRYFTIITTAVAAFSPMVAADWGWPEDPFVTATCAATCNSLALAFSRDKVKDYCSELVKDGCHGGVASFYPGAATFAANRDIDCKDTGPRDVTQCQEAFEHVILQTKRWGGPGATLSAMMYVYNHNGDQAGAVSVTGGCIPIDPLNIGLC